mmetsp:Transcript_28666/g.46022  ORF Transcript_28666/g.46022 Transcript_28666/m.46022 type:complete len:169 (+) Transcript_28666:71-577(+)
MTATLQSVGFAVSGAVLMQVLPGLLMQSQVTGATWGWSTTPQCKPAAGSNWAFSAAVNAGTSGTIVCANTNATLPANGSTVACLSSTGASSPDNGWWNTCGPGMGECKGKKEIGSGRSCTGGTAPTMSPAAMAAMTTTKAAGYGAVSFADNGAAPGLLIAVAALAHLV